MHTPKPEHQYFQIDLVKFFAPKNKSTMNELTNSFEWFSYYFNLLKQLLFVTSPERIGSSMLLYAYAIVAGNPYNHFILDLSTDFRRDRIRECTLANP